MIGARALHQGDSFCQCAAVTGAGLRGEGVEGGWSGFRHDDNLSSPSLPRRGDGEVEPSLTPALSLVRRGNSRQSADRIYALAALAPLCSPWLIDWSTRRAAFGICGPGPRIAFTPACARNA